MDHYQYTFHIRHYFKGTSVKTHFLLQLMYIFAKVEHRKYLQPVYIGV